MMIIEHFRQMRYLSTKSILCSNKIKQISPVGHADGLNVKPVIGLEVHAQLKTKSKLFSQGSNLKTTQPNSHLDLFDISLPGTLPKLNLEAVKLALLAALGLNCTIQDVIHFDRKNYFYSDMPAGYQITQYNKPIAMNGFIDFIVSTYHHSVIAHTQHYDLIKYSYPRYRSSFEEFEPYLKRSSIKQIQLEQDSAKTISHTVDDLGLKLIDYNRCGVALMEIVFEPDLTSANEASSLVRALITLLKSLNVCGCDLHEGSLRVDANVSINSINGELIDPDIARRVELKNLNSIRSLFLGVSAEIKRQAAEIVQGNKILQESRSFDTKTSKVEPMRAKEEAVDYRYMPEPNLPPLKIDQAIIQEAQSRITLDIDLPINQRKTLKTKFDLDELLILELTDEPGLSDYFMDIMDTSTRSQSIQYEADCVADFLIYAINNLKKVEISTVDVNLSQKGANLWLRLPPNKMQNLLDMVFNEEISFASALEVMRCLLLKDDSAVVEDIVKDLDLFQTNDHVQIDAACRDVMHNAKGLPKKFFTTGNPKFLLALLNKLNESYNGKINPRKAAEYFNCKLLEHKKVDKN